ncbi:MAG: hypothetical protein IKQ97_02150 [Eubacterium sp.]|nr:hypothetical protein [Eubacterium sp.]
MRTIFDKKAISRLAAIALALSVVAPAATVTTSVAAGAKAPKLSETSKALEAGDGFTLMVDPNGVKGIVSTTWTVNGSTVTLSGQSNTSTVVTAVDADGISTVSAAVKYKVVVKKKKKKKTVTKSKTLNCNVTVSKKKPVDEGTIVPSYNSTAAAFELAFLNERANLTAPTTQDANGSSWTGTAADAVASVVEQGGTSKAKITNVVLSSNGLRVAVYVDVSSLRNGVKYDVNLIGFYMTLVGPPAAPTTQTFSMTTPVTGIPLMIDEAKCATRYYERSVYYDIRLTQPGYNPTTYDSTASNYATTVGVWTSSASKVVTVTDLSTNQKWTVDRVEARSDTKNRASINNVVIVMTKIPEAGKQYRFDVMGFTPVGGGSVSNMSVTATFDNQGMMKTNVKAQRLTKTTKINGMDTDYVVAFDVSNYTGRDTLLKRGGGGNLAPSAHLKAVATVEGGFFSSDSTKDISGDISYIKSTKGGHTIEIGIRYTSKIKKLVLSFKESFPIIFLDLANDAKVDPGKEITIDKFS